LASAGAPETPLEAFTGDHAWEAFQKKALFLDARLPADYADGRIPGALNLPLRAVDFEDRLQAFLASPETKPMDLTVVYCSGCCSTDSLFLAQWLKDCGFTQIHIYRDGFPGWLRAGHPHAVGDTPLAAEVK
jgi:rhodanese-related sulfurtransferase